MSNVNEANAPADWSDRIVGDPRYTRALWLGEVPMPRPSARAKWEARQAWLWNGNDTPYRARMFLPILRAFIAEMGPRCRDWTIATFEEGLEEIAAEAGENKRGTRTGGSR
jgi:hypothetical protein